jgi:hypothetical protein
MIRRLIILLLIVGCGSIVELLDIPDEPVKTKDGDIKQNIDDNYSSAINIEFPDLSSEDIYEKTYLWLEWKFPNLDDVNFVETKADGKIRITGKGLVLETELLDDWTGTIQIKRMKFKIIVVINVESKSVSFGIRRMSSKKSKRKKKYDGKKELEQSYIDFLEG